MSIGCSPTSSRTRTSAATFSRGAIALYGARRRRRACAILALALLASACGKKGPPLAPVRVSPYPPGLLRVRQIGTEVVLSASLPGTRTDGTRLGPGTVVRILRMPATGTFRPEAVSARYLVQQFEKQASEIAKLSGEELQRSMVLGRLQYSDRDVLAAVAPGGGPHPRFLYALQVVEDEKSRSPLRAPAQIEVGPPPPAPADLRAEVAEGEVRLAWTPGGDRPADAPAADASASGEGKGAATAAPPAHGFNVYRREAAATAAPEDPINPRPLSEPAFVDTTFRYDVAYAYFVRTVDALAASPRESVAGPSIEVRPHDSFPPTAPAGIAVAAEGAVIRIYWFPNAEPDLAGYRIYRRAAAEKDPVRIGEAPATETSYIDSGATQGVRYHYSVSAIDGADPINESPRSEERSEMLSGGGGG